MLVVSGQVRYDTTVASTGLDLRQLGDQEFDIARAAATMTKYSVMVVNPADIRYHLERCCGWPGRAARDLAGSTCRTTCRARWSMKTPCAATIRPKTPANFRRRLPPQRQTR